MSDPKEAVFELMLRLCKPLYCHEHNAPWPRPITGGTCFFLRFGDALFGVTAGHVLDTLLRRNQERQQVFQVGTAGIDLPNSIIDMSAELDIATFRFEAAALENIGGIAFDSSPDE